MQGELTDGHFSFTHLKKKKKIKKGSHFLLVFSGIFYKVAHKSHKNILLICKNHNQKEMVETLIPFLS